MDLIPVQACGVIQQVAREALATQECPSAAAAARPLPPLRALVAYPGVTGCPAETPSETPPGALICRVEIKDHRRQRAALS